MIYPFWAQIIFAISAFNFFWIAWLFFRSKNGWLRILLIVVFATLGYSSSMRCFERYVGPFLDVGIMSIVVGLPVMIATSVTVLYLRKNYNSVQ